MAQGIVMKWGFPGKEIIMADITDILKKAFLAGVGAAAEGTEKADQLMKDMVRKGELTVEQGKALNQELKHNLNEKLQKKEKPKADVSTFLSQLSKEDLRELKKKLDEIDSEDQTGDDDI